MTLSVEDASSKGTGINREAAVVAVATYLIAISLVAVCVASSFVSFAAYEVSRKKTLAYLGVFAIAYGVEQAFILFNEYNSHNLPFNAEWGAMEDPLSHIVLGVVLCQSLYLVILDFVREERKGWRYGPLAGFIVISLIIYAVGGIDDALRKWMLYSLRQIFLLGAAGCFWLRYLRVSSKVEKARYRRKVPVVAVFTALVAFTFLEDLLVMLFVAEPSIHDVFLTEFLYRRNIFEMVLCLCAIGYAALRSVHALELKRDDAPASSEPHRRQMREAVPYFAKRYELSLREEEILAFMLDGADNQRIASQLQVALGTVKTHTHHIFKKAGVSNRAELIQKFWSES